MEAQSRAQSEAQSIVVLQGLLERPLSSKELVQLLGLKSKTGSFNQTMKDLLDRKLIEYTIPDKLGSHLQKYRLFEKGKKWIKGNILS